MPSSSSSKKPPKTSTTNTSMSSSKNPITTNTKPSSSSKNKKKSHPTSHPSSSSTHTHQATNHTATEGPATTAYKFAQKQIPPRTPTPQGSAASSQACESADVSESERGVMRRERKDVVHYGPGAEV